jgi:hypothetical protein
MLDENEETQETMFIPVPPPVDMLPIGSAPAENIRPALELTRQIAELGILGVVVAVTPTQSGHKLAMPDWSHLSAGGGGLALDLISARVVPEVGGRVGFTAELADEAGMDRTMSALNAVCELIRRTREAADGLEKVVNATLAGMARLGVDVVSTADLPEADTAEGDHPADDEVTAPGSTAEPLDVVE